VSLLDIFRPAPRYTDLDFDSATERLDDLILGTFPDLQNNPNKMTMWRLFQGAVAFMLEVLAKRINNAARQSRITTVTQMAAALGLFRLIGYTPPGRQAATVALVFTIASVLAEDVPIASGFVVKTGGTSPLSYRALEASVIPAGQLTATVQFKNSELQDDFFLSNNKKNQKFLLTYSPLVFNADNTAAATITAANGAYTQAPNNNLFYSGRADKHYEIYSDDLERGVIRFGDGVNGEVPVGQIQVSYETGGGARGNVAAGLIEVPVGNLVDTDGNLATFTVENEDDASGGSDRPTLGRLKWLAPLSQTASPVTVKRSDFSTRAVNVSGVDRAIAVTSNQDAGIPENTTYVYIVPDGGGTASETLRTNVKNLFKGDGAPYPTTETHEVEVFSAIYKTVDWRVVVYLREGVTEARARAAIVAAQDAFFSTTISSDDPSVDGAPNPDIDFGGNLKDPDGNVNGLMAWSDMFDVIKDITQVRRIDPVQGFLVNEEQDDVILLPSEFPTAGNIIMINGATGEAF
jgi:hypothetical protein